MYYRYALKTVNSQQAAYTQQQAYTQQPAYIQPSGNQQQSLLRASAAPAPRAPTRPLDFNV